MRTHHHRPYRNMPSTLNGWLLLGVYVSSLILLTCSQTIADSSKGCEERQHKCICGTPRCIEPELVKNGVQDCQDGSDEGQWDPSKCAIKNNTSEDIRFKRAALSELSRLTKNGATTTFFSGDRGRTRPVGLLTTTMGSFVTSGTTTEYITKVLATYIKGTYARIVSTSSRIYHAIPTEGSDMMDAIRPTGFIASTVSNEINGYATTAHTTDFYRTYIDGTYAQLVSSYSNVHYPPWYTDPIVATAANSLPGGTVQGAAIYATPAVVEPAEPSLSSEYLFEAANTDARVRTVIVPTRVVPISQNTLLPAVLHGRIDAGKNAVAGLGIVESNNKIQAFRPNNKESEIKVTGTHGKFVQTGSPGEETTYNVFTGTYLQNSKTFLFFFGNTALEPAKTVAPAVMPTLQVENGPPRSNNVVLDMSKNLKVIIPQDQERIPIQGSIQGSQMEGILVEIEASEQGDYVTVDGAVEDAGTPRSPQIDKITVTLGLKDLGLEPSQVHSSSSSRPPIIEIENEIPTGRKVPDLRPSSARQISLPTFTVGQETEELEYATTENVQRDYADAPVAVSTSSSSRKSAPVFQRAGSSPPPQKIASPALTKPKSPSPPKVESPRSSRAFQMKDLMGGMNNEVENDLQSAASTGRATVTYVGFADFTTTVGNTVIIFAPRTKIVEDMAIKAAKTATPTIQPTAILYGTTKEPEEESTTTSTTSTSSKPSTSTEKRTERPPTTTPKSDDEGTTELEPSEATVVVSGRQTVFVDQSAGALLTPQFKPVPTPELPSSSSRSFTPTRKTVFPTLSRSRFLPKHLQQKSSSRSSQYSAVVEPTPIFKPFVPEANKATTVVLQPGKHNPTGLVSSIGNSVVNDGSTTLFTTLVYGTFIQSSYAQVIKSTSQVIAPSSVRLLSSSKPVVTYEYTTTEHVDDDENTTIPNIVQYERTESSTSSTTESSSKRKTTTSKPEEPETTTQAESDDDDEDYTTTTSSTTSSTSSSTTPKSIDEDKENEVETARKVQGRPRDQVIVPVEDKPEETQEGDDDEDQTIYITRTVPTTLFRTYTYFTTYFLPQEGTTITSITSREETSTAVGVVKKTFASVIPTASASLDPEDEELEPSRAEDEDEIEPTGSQIVYKTFFTTYTYLTTFFTGQTTSVSSREEVVSNIVTLTQSKSPAAAPSSIIEPTSSAALLSSVQPTRSGRLSVIRKSRTKSTPVVEPTQELEPESSSSAEVEPTSPSVVTATVHKTFYTTYTYFTTLFNGEDTSIKSRTEVITNVVPTVTRIVPSATEQAVEATSEATPTDEYEEEEEEVDDAKETTFYTTYTHLTTFFVDDTESLKSSLATYTRVLKGNKILRTGKVDEPIEPTSLSGRSVVRPTAVTPAPTEAEDLNEVGSNLSETSETTARSTSEQPEASTESVSHADYYELDGSEGTTHATTYDDESSKSEGPVEEIDGTPALRTYFTTFTFYTTFYKAGTSTVTSRLETVTNVVSDVTEKEDATSTSEPAYPITYYTTYTYWTTSFKEGSPVVTSREETVSNVVTPGVDDVAPSTISSSSTEIQATSTSATQDSDLTTYFTTYTYYTTSYLKDETIVTSRLETVTNVISGSDAPTTVSPTAVEARAVGTVKPEISDNDQPHDEDDDYDLPTGLLSTIVSSEVVDMTTTVHSTDVYGTYIDGIYAQVLESTSLLISPTASLETSFIPDATVSETGLVSVNQGAIKDADGAATTFYTTKAYGTIIDGSYAHLLDKTSSVLNNENISPSDDPLKTGLVRVIDGSIVEGEQTTYYTSSILGTIIDNQYAQVIESTSRYVINPTRSEDGTTVSPTRLAELESSEAQTTTEDIPTTTEAATEEKKADPLRRLPGQRGRGSNRLSFTSASKSFTPLITPFASRSRPAFAPRRRQSSAIVVSRTDVTPTVTATLAASTSATPASRGSSFANRRRPAFRGSEAESTTPSSTASEATPRLPFAPGRSRFSRPTGPARPSAATIAPTSTSSRGSSFAGGAGSSRRGGFNARGSSSSVRNPSLARSSRPGATVSFSTSAIRGSSSSRFNPRARSTAAIRPTSTEVTTVKPTSQLAPQDEEYEIIEYEYEEPVSSSSSTTEKPSTPASRLGGNRFRLNPRLSTPNPPSTTTNAPRIAPARNIPSLRKNIFTRPTPSTRGTTAAATTSDDDEEQDEAPAATTPKPRPTFNNRARTTLAPATTTTTRRTFAPRQRPLNFPSRGLFRPASTTASKEKEEEDGELEYEETRNIASGNLTAIEPQADGSNRYETYVRAPAGFSNSHRGDLIGSGSEFYSNIVPAAGDDDGEEGEYPRARPNARVLRRAPRQVDQYGYRYRGSSSNNYNRRQVDNNNARSNSRSSSSFSPQPSYYSDYYDDSPEPPATPAPVPSTRGSSRFRGRITPTPSQTNARRTPFTLTNSDSSTSRPTSSNSRSSNSNSGTNSNSFSRRSQSRYQRPVTTEAPTTSRSSRFRSRYRQTEATTSRSTSSRNRFPSSSRTRGSTTYTDRNRYDTYNSPKKVEADEPAQLGTITVTHYVPAETTIPVVNGKVTEYKTILTPSASKEVLGPHQYSLTDYGGAQVLAINSELTSTPSFGVTEVTRFIIRESATTSVTFTPTTIRGRRTSFSHIVPSTVYSVEPVVSTLAPNPLLTDQNQLTNLLLSQLLGNLNLNPNLLGLQQQQQALQQQQQLKGLMNNQDPATPITHFNTRTTSYVTTVTDFTSTVLPITLHGKSIKTTVVESSTHVITATEFITDSTVITPTPQMVFQPTLLAPLNNINNNPGLNPALLQNLLQQQLLQQQQQQQQQQQPQIPILPTQPPQLILPTLSPTINSKNSNSKDKEHEQEEESNVKNVKVEAVQEKNEFSVVTLYVSGRNPGEFSTIVSTVPVDSPKRKRSVLHADYYFEVVPTQQVAIQPAVEPTKLLQSSLLIDPEEVIEENLVDFFDGRDNNEGESTVTLLESSYDSNTIKIPSSSRHQVPTQSLDSVLGDVSRLISQSAR